MRHLLSVAVLALAACHAAPCDPPAPERVSGLVSWRNATEPTASEYAPQPEPRYAITVDGVERVVNGVVGPSWFGGPAKQPKGEVPAPGTVTFHAAGGPSMFRPQDSWAEIVLSPP